jgi:hypothetical protein
MLVKTRWLFHGDMAGVAGVWWLNQTRYSMVERRAVLSSLVMLGGSALVLPKR